MHTKANEAVNNVMPLSSSSSNSSPISTSLLLQTETGCIESSLLSNSINSNDNNINKSIKNKTGTISINFSSISQRKDNISKNKKTSNASFNMNNNGKIKANRKRKISASATSSIQLIPANPQSYTDLATSTAHRSLIANCNSTSRIENTLQVKIPKLTSAMNSLLQPVDLHSLTDSSFYQQRQQRALTSFNRITTQASVLLSTLFHSSTQSIR